MSSEKNGESTPDDVAQFSGAMDELVAKYDEIINEFTSILDKQTRKLFNDPDLSADD